MSRPTSSGVCKGSPGGQVEANLSRAAFAAPGGVWTKALGSAAAGRRRPWSRRADGGLDATRVRAVGAGVDADGAAAWRGDGGMTVRAASLKLPGTYDGALELVRDGAGERLTGRARFVDARSLVDDLTGGARRGPRPAARGPAGSTCRPTRCGSPTRSPCAR